MTRGNVQLNGVHYITQGMPQKSLANQMASKVGQGASGYGDLTSWSAWVQQDWTEGVGKLQPHLRGGTLYSEAETRVPGQMILAGRPFQTDERDLDGTRSDARYMPNNVAGTWTVSSSGPNTRVAIPYITTGVSVWEPYKMACCIYLRASVGQILNFEIRSDTAGSPSNTVYGSDTVTVINDTKGFYWYGALLTADGLAAGAAWLIVYPTSGSIEVAYGTSGYDTASKLLISSSWTTQTGQYGLFTVPEHRMSYRTDETGDNGGYTFGRIGSDIYLSTLQSEVFKYVPANDNWIQHSTLINEWSNSAVEWDGELYLSHYPGAGNARSIDSAGTVTNLGYEAHVFARGGLNGGYLWRALDNIPYYTNVTTPTSGDWITFDEMAVGIASYPILAMCAVGEDMFMTTAEGLYRCVPGDITVLVTPWSSTNRLNGLYMVNFQGALYVTAEGRVFRYQDDGTLQDVWIMRDDDLVAGRLGRVRSICVVNNSVVALASSEVESSFPTLWAFVNESWHHLAILPYNAPNSSTTGDRLYSMFHDTVTNYLWIASPSGSMYRMYVSETAVNPYNDSSTIYQPYGWVEWDWFDSPVLDAPKDFHSVKIFGENMGSDCKATVYWKDDDSTGWELLGTSDIDHEDLEWTITGGTRPNTHRFKLGVLLSTTDVTQTPRIRAIRVKYHLMVKDWWRWNMQIECAGKSEAYLMSMDGTRMALTADQINTNIEALAVQVPPFVYVDIDNKQWLVKVQDASFTPSKQVYRADTLDYYYEGIWSIVIESVKAEQYSA